MNGLPTSCEIEEDIGKAVEKAKRWSMSADAFFYTAPQWEDILRAEDPLTLLCMALVLRAQLDETLEHYKDCLT